MSVKIRFICESDGQEKEVLAEAGEKLIQAAYRAGVIIQQTCGGTPSCADCKVVVKSGIEDGFEAPEAEEKALMGNVYFITKERLACQALIKSSSSVWVPDPKKIKDQRRKKR